jgi:hypothetical protein
MPAQHRTTSDFPPDLSGTDRLSTADMKSINRGCIGPTTIVGNVTRDDQLADAYSTLRATVSRQLSVAESTHYLEHAQCFWEIGQFPPYLFNSLSYHVQP